MLWFALACADPEAVEVPRPGCPSGTVDEGGVCVPDACAGGPWGALEGDLWVDASASGGDGSKELPYSSIAEAMDAAERGDVIALAAGTYAETLSLKHPQREITLAGACAERVVLDASGFEKGSAIYIEGQSGDTFALRGLSVVGGPQFGVAVNAGELTLEGVVIADTHGTALFGDGEDTRIFAQDVAMLNSMDDPGLGMGVALQSGASAELRGVVIRHAETIGVGIYSGASAIFEDTLVDQGGVPTGGFSIEEARLELRGVSVVDATGIGLEAYDSEVVIDGFRVDGVARIGENKGAYGLGATASTVSGRGLALAHTQRHALVLSDADFDLEDVEIWGVHPGEFTYSPGAVVMDGSAGRLAGLRVHDNTGLGLAFVDCAVGLEDVVVEEQAPSDAAVYTAAMQFQGGEFTIEGLLIQGVDGLGLIAADDAVGEARDVVVRDLRADAIAGKAMGISVERGAALVLEGATIEDSAIGGMQVAEAWASVRDLEVTRTGSLVYEGLWTAVSVYQGGELILEDASIHDLIGTGVGAQGAGTRLTVKNTEILDTRGHPGMDGGLGVSVHSGATAELEGVVVTRPAHTALQVGLDGASVVVRDFMAVDVQPAGMADRPFARGVEILYGGDATISDLVVEGALELGLLVQHEATLLLSGAEISGIGLSPLGREAMGLSVELGSTAVVEDLWVHDTLGTGIHEADSDLLCAGCVVERVAFGGAIAEGGRLELVDCAISDVAESVAMGGGMGIFADTTQHGFTELRVEGSTVEGAAMSGVYLAGQGSYQLRDSVLEGAAGLEVGGQPVHGEVLFAREGVGAWDGAAGLLVEDCALQATPGHRAVLLHGAAGSFAGVEVSGSELDLRQQACEEGLEPPAGLEDFATVDLCPLYSELIITIDYEFYALDGVIAE